MARPSMLLLFASLLLGEAGGELLRRRHAEPAQIPTREVAPGVQMPEVMCGMGGALMMSAVLSESGRERARQLADTWLGLGGRGLDTAQVYNTEAAAGAAWQASGVPREEVFLLTKLDPSTAMTFQAGAVKRSVAESLRKLGASALDLLLLHFPGPRAEQAWREMEELHAEGKVRALGVSNFEVDQLQRLMATAKVPVAVNQRKMNIHTQDTAALDFCLRHNVTYQAYRPLDEGSGSLLRDPAVLAVAARANRTAAQVALKWVLQRGAALTVQSEKEEHQRQDMDLFSWSLAPEDVAALDAAR